MKAGEVAASADIGINADGVSKIEWDMRFLSGVTGDHNLTRAVRLGRAKFFVNDGEGELLVERDIMLQVRMDEDVGISLEVWFTFPEKLPVLGRNIIESAGAV